MVGKLAGQPSQNSWSQNWRPISSIVSQGLVPEQILFNVFIRYLDDGTEGTQQVHGGTLQGAVNTLEESATQRTLYKFEK